MTPLVFLLLAAMGLVGAVQVVLQRNPVVSALYLVLSFMSLAGMYVLLSAPFLAAVQVVVYAGAIMVLFIFVIMLLNLRHDIDDGLTHVARRVLGWTFALILAGVFYAMLNRPWALGPLSDDRPDVIAQTGNTHAVGMRLYTDYLFPFEVTSLILLVGIIGAVVLAMRRSDLLASTAEPTVPKAAATPTAGARPAEVIGEQATATTVSPEGQGHPS
jgi:NADH-quinone oxidoreductase subunit J